MVPGASPVVSTTIWRRNSGLTLRYGTSGTLKPLSVKAAYITSALVTFLSTLIAGRIGGTEPVAVLSSWSIGIPPSPEVEQPAALSSASAPAPDRTARRER